MDENLEISSLKNEVRSLMEEREVLLEGREDIQLLAQISEKVNGLDNERDILDAVLESFCVLKDMAYASFLESRDGRFVVTNEYRNLELPSLQNEEFSGQKYPDLARALRIGRLTSEQFEVPLRDSLFIPSPARGPFGMTVKCCLLSVSIVGNNLGLVVIVDFSKKTRLTEKTLMLFERAIAVAVSRIEIMRMMQEIRKLNIELMEKYAKRGAELKASEQKYRSLFENANDPTYLVEPETLRILDCNKKAEESSGYSYEELKKMNFSDLHPVEERNLLRPKFKEVLEKGGAFVIPGLHHLRGDRGPSPVEVNVALIEAGREKLNLCIVRDIAARLRAEKLMNEKERSIRDAYSSALSAVTGGRLIILDAEDILGRLGEPISNVHDITSYEDLTRLRLIIEEVVGPYFSNPNTCKDIVLAADEASVNSIKHAGRGRFQVFKKSGVIQVLVEDKGPGIDFNLLPKATLAAGYSSKLSLGVGFTVMLGVSDSVLLATQSGGGTKIVLECRQEKNEEFQEPKEQHLNI